MKLRTLSVKSATAVAFVIVMASLSVLWCPAHAEDNLISTFYDRTDSSFSVQVIGPATIIREFAICKGIWFAEKKKLANVSFGNPHYGGAKRIAPDLEKVIHVPADWVVLDTTVYWTDANPDKNPMVRVSDRSAECRQMWPWYR